MKYDVFISYSREDYLKNNQPDENSVVAKVLKTFDEAGITYWIDKECIYSGNEFAEVISNAIEDSRVFLFISTVNSNASKWTAREIASAEDIQHPIVPFRVDRTPYNRQIRLFVANLDYIDFQKNGDKAFDALLTAVNKHLDRIKAKEQEEERIKLEETEEHQAKERERIRKAMLQTRYLVRLDMIQEQIVAQQEKRNELIREMEEEGLEPPVEEETPLVETSNGNTPIDNDSDLNEIQPQPNEFDAFNQDHQKSKKIKMLYALLGVGLCAIIILGVSLFFVDDDRDGWKQLYNNENNELCNVRDDLRELSNTNPMIISKIEIANTDSEGNILTNYGKKIYSKEKMYLRLRIAYYGLFSGEKLLKIKCYRLNDFFRDKDDSPFGFSQEKIVRIDTGKNLLTLSGWGNERKRYWKRGRYCIEIWYQNVCLGSKTFNIL